MKKVLIAFPVIILMATGCVAKTPPRDTIVPDLDKAPSITQGISGNAKIISGDCMPSTAAKTTCRTEPARSRKITVRELTTYKQMGNGKPTTRLVAQTTTTNAGAYAVSIAAGTYSIFIYDDQEREICNSFDGKMNACSVVVGDGVTQYDVTLDQAVY